MNLTVEKNDIYKIGHTHFYDENGNLQIITSVHSCGVEEILLRNILKCFGEEYKITEVEDYWGDEDEFPEDVCYVTNLPYNYVHDDSDLKEKNSEKNDADM